MKQAFSGTTITHQQWEWDPYFLKVINRDQWQDEERTLTSLVFTPPTVKHPWHTTLSVTHSERRLFCARVCMWVCVVIFCHPSCLALSVLLGPWGQSSPFSEENGIRKNGRDKAEHRGRVCNELFMSSSVWSAPGVLQYAVGVCVCVQRCWMSFNIASEISSSILFCRCGMCFLFLVSIA